METPCALIAASGTLADSAVLSAVVAASFLAVVEGARRILDFRRRHHERVIEASLALLRTMYQIDRLAQKSTAPSAPAFADEFQRFDDSYRTLQILADQDIWKSAQHCKVALKGVRDAAGTDELESARETMKRARLSVVNALRGRLRKQGRFARRDDPVVDERAL